MGEAKRKKEAALNGPCPCGSGKTAHLCCFTGQGWQWHKQPAILGLKTLPPAGRVEKCYMKELGSCVPPISGEHIISEFVCQVLMGDGEFSISGVPWLEAGETKIIAPPQANCLCRKHNSSLSPLDLPRITSSRRSGRISNTMPGCDTQLFPGMTSNAGF